MPTLKERDKRNNECFQHRSISSLSTVIIRVSVFLKRTVGDSDCHFDNRSGSHCQSQSDIETSVNGIYVSGD